MVWEGGRKWFPSRLELSFSFFFFFLVGGSSGSSQLLGRWRNGKGELPHTLYITKPIKIFKYCIILY